MNIIVYSKDHCPNCVTAKNLLKAKGLEFEERNIGQPFWESVLRKKAPDARQLPQIFINEQSVGGLAGLQAALKQLGV